jgi:hypothetical protein
VRFSVDRHDTAGEPPSSTPFSIRYLYAASLNTGFAAEVALAQIAGKLPI